MESARESEARSDRQRPQARLDQGHHVPAPHAAGTPASRRGPSLRQAIERGNSQAARSSGSLPVSSGSEQRETAVDQHQGHSSAAQEMAASWRRRLAQAEELATHLRDRLAEVDRREARLNAHAADLESREREFRLWAESREHEFQERERELQIDAEQLRQEIESWQGKRAAVESQHRALEQEVAEKSDDLDRQLAEIRKLESDVQAAAEARRQQLDRQERDLLTREEGIQDGIKKVKRRSELNRREAEQLRQTREVLDSQIEAFHVMRDEQLGRLRKERQEHQSFARQRGQYLDAQQRELQRQLDQLSQQKSESVVEQYALQELWVRVCDRLDRELAERQLRELRLRLYHHFDRQLSELRQQRSELQRARQSESLHSSCNTCGLRR